MSLLSNPVVADYVEKSKQVGLTPMGLGDDPRPLKKLKARGSLDYASRRHKLTIMQQVETGMKTCTKCKVSRPLSDYSADPGNTDGLQPGCNNCRRDMRFKRRLAVIEKYGGCCANCKEKYPRFINIDHINGDGRQHWKEIGGGGNISQWLLRNPVDHERFRLLCWNCNLGLNSLRTNSLTVLQLTQQTWEQDHKLLFATDFTQYEAPETKLCSRCHSLKPIDAFWVCKTNRSGRYSYCHRCMAEWQLDIKQQCLDHYGAACANCDISLPHFLAFDHINGGGRAEQRSGRDASLPKWLKRHNFPAGFRTLCHNCNGAVYHFGGDLHLLNTDRQKYG